MTSLFENPDDADAVEQTRIDIERERRINRAAETLLDLPRSEWGGAAERAADGDADLAAAILKRLTYLDDHLDDDDDDEAPDFAPGDVVGNCVLRREIGHGAHGSIWEAEQKPAKRRVAVKLVKPEVLTDSLKKRLAYESRALARLEHPGVARLYVTGEHPRPAGEPVPFLVMELIENASPITAFAAGVPLRRRLEIFTQVTDAIQHAHARGLIHRDLKPANIVVDADGRARVIDFGVARPSAFDPDALPEHAELDESAGTPAYMAPEQCSGKPELVDTRADIYALGVILYEILTAARFLAFDKSEPLPDRLRRVREHVAPPPSTLNRDAAGDLDAIVARCLEKNPEARYDTAAQLRDDLRAHLSGDPISIRADELGYQIITLARRHRSRVLIAAIAVIAAAGVLATLLVSAAYTQRVRDERDAARQDRTEATATADAFDRYVELFFDEVQINDDRSIEAVVEEALGRLASERNSTDRPEFARRAPVVEAIVRANLGESLERRARYEEARRALRSALVLFGGQTLDAADMERADLVRQRLIQRFLLDANAAESEGNAARAASLRRDAEPLIEIAIERGETKGPSFGLAFLNVDLAEVRAATERPTEAAEPLERATELLRTLSAGEAPPLLVEQLTSGIQRVRAMLPPGTVPEDS